MNARKLALSSAAVPASPKAIRRLRPPDDRCSALGAMPRQHGGIRAMANLER
jgi:hypothetical protein